MAVQLQISEEFLGQLLTECWMNGKSNQRHLVAKNRESKIIYGYSTCKLIVLLVIRDVRLLLVLFHFFEHKINIRVFFRSSLPEQ